MAVENSWLFEWLIFGRNSWIWQRITKEKMSWESFVFSLKHPEFPSGNDPIWRLRIFFEKMGGKKPTNLEESCFGGIHSLRNFGICRGKGAPWLKSPGKKEHVWGLVYPMWHKLGSAGGVVFFGGMVGWESFGPFFMGVFVSMRCFSRVFQLCPCWNLFRSTWISPF